MKKRELLANIFLTFIPMVTFAGWEVSKPEAAVPREPFFQAAAPSNMSFVPSAYSASVFPNQYIDRGQTTPMYAISICGSLKENLERIMGRYNWRVVWKAGYDYNFDGRVTGSSLPNVIEKLLQPFPLRAVMYKSNRTLAVVPRFTT